MLEVADPAQRLHLTRGAKDGGDASDAAQTSTTQLPTEVGAGPSCFHPCDEAAGNNGEGGGAQEPPEFESHACSSLGVTSTRVGAVGSVAEKWHEGWSQLTAAQKRWVIVTPVHFLPVVDVDAVVS
jgi:hypothetical protein